MMCEQTSHRSSTAFAEGRADLAAGRRTLLKVAGAGGAALAFSTATGLSPAEAATRTRKRAYVLVLDGCRPQEITPDLMPATSALRARGLHFPNAQALPVLETLPNHVMMMTGVRPDRSGVPANEIYDRELGDIRTMDRPRDIRVRTVIQRINDAGLTTGTVLSKEYLYGVFGRRATHRWEPAPIVPVSGHAPDVATMEAALAMRQELDPHLMFVNLGDIDRAGHSDATGGVDLKAARTAALSATDSQVARFVADLKESGRWRHSVVIVLADHSMDWSIPTNVVHLQPAIDADPLLSGKVVIADNGGADLLYWTGRARDRDRAVRRMVAIARATPGVLAAHDRERADWLRLDRLAGDVVVWCKAGWRFTDPDVWSNPIPGNHGHPATRPIPFFIGGGHPVVPRGRTSSRRVQTVDVAPTLSRFFGVGGPRGGYDGKPRLPRP